MVTNFGLASYCRLVIGSRSAAIYDLKSGDVYQLDADETKVILGELVDKNNLWKKLEKWGLTGENSSGQNYSTEEVYTPSLEKIFLEITNTCNAACIHCYGDFKLRVAQAESGNKVDWLEVLKSAAAIGCRWVQFTGGEPLLHPEWKKLVVKASELGFSYIEIFTNALLLKEEDVLFLHDHSVHLAISFYSIDESIHDSITRYRGSGARAKVLISSLVDHQVDVRVAIIVMGLNQKTLDQTVQYVLDSGVSRPSIDVVRSVGRGKNLPADCAITTAYSHRTEPSFRTSGKAFLKAQRYNTCLAGRLAIKTNGDVLPCVFARDRIMGNVLNESLDRIIQKENVHTLWTMNLDRVAVCQNCEFRYACGNCRFLAESVTGNLLAKNPRCFYNPDEGTWNASLES